MILLTFNLRSFQVPTEKQGLFSMKELDEISIKGTQSLLRILENAEIQATFFIESHFAERNPELIKSIVAKNFGIAHWYTEENIDQLAESKKILEEVPVRRYSESDMLPIVMFLLRILKIWIMYMMPVSSLGISLNISKR